MKQMNSQIKLRPWQDEALSKSLNWLLDRRVDKHFLINAAPGAGKTIAACSIANALLGREEIDRVIVIAPRSEVVNQWSSDFQMITRRPMMKVTAADGDVGTYDWDVCATWAAVQGLLSEFKKICERHRTLVICDEHHHAAVEAAWGRGANDAFVQASFVLILSGTPIRSDGKKSVWLAYDDAGAIDVSDDGSFTLTYGDAVRLGYCRPAVFHRHEGLFNVDFEGDIVNVSGKKAAELPQDMKRIPGLQRALNFYALACTPQYEKDEKTPLRTGYQATMLDAASEKLDDLRDRMPDAGGLVIAPSIEMAEYFANLIKTVEGEAPILVHNKVQNPDSKIDLFRKTPDMRWLVSVAMVSEGVDIPRLRVLIYLSSALTELSFRQAVGRMVRTNGPDDYTNAYVVMPSFDILENYARRIESEMPTSVRRDQEDTKTKLCPVCRTECDKSTSVCPVCKNEFPKKAARTRECPKCHSVNRLSAKKCENCGHSFVAQFHLTLEETLRAGVITREIDLSEEETREGEALAADVRAKILKSGDENLLRLLKTFPEETFGRLKAILREQ
jgi:superfamily II DNA or RNA helicase